MREGKEGLQPKSGWDGRLDGTRSASMRSSLSVRTSFLHLVLRYQVRIKQVPVDWVRRRPPTTDVDLVIMSARIIRCSRTTSFARTKNW